MFENGVAVIYLEICFCLLRRNPGRSVPAHQFRRNPVIIVSYSKAAQRIQGKQIKGGGEHFSLDTYVFVL